MLEQHRHLIEAALAKSPEGFSFADVAEDIEAGRATLWTGPDSVAVTRLRRFNAMWVWTAAGEAEEVKRMAERAEAVARKIGCDAIMGGGRDGWTRVMRPLGWAPLVMKELGQ